jgi:hypothetical protein
MNTTPIDLPIGAGYLCHKCGHTEGDVMSDSPWDYKKCSKCGKTEMLHIGFGRNDQIIFVFTWAHGTETYNMNNRMETRKISIYTIDGYADFDEDGYEAIKLDKAKPVKGLAVWSITFGLQLTKIDGIRVTGFPFGFDSYKLEKSIKLDMLPDHIQLIQKINQFVQRYMMGFVELKGRHARKSTWQMQPKPTSP